MHICIHFLLPVGINIFIPAGTNVQVFHVRLEAISKFASYEILDSQLFQERLLLQI